MVQHGIAVNAASILPTKGSDMNVIQRYEVKRLYIHEMQSRLSSMLEVLPEDAPDSLKGQVGEVISSNMEERPVNFEKAIHDAEALITTGLLLIEQIEAIPSETKDERPQSKKRTAKSASPHPGE